MWLANTRYDPEENLMSQSLENLPDTAIADPRWKDLYRIGGISSIFVAVSVLLAIIAFFIWPFKPGFTSTENIFMTLQNDRLGGLISLDLLMLLIAPVSMLPFLALYVALKRVNESYAFIALALGVLAVAVLIPSRPLVELVALSDKYTAATSEVERSQYLAAGESLHALFNGTAWAAQTIFFLLAGLINGLLMLRARPFSKATAWTGIVASIIGLGFFVPIVGMVLLFANTILSVIWSILLARDFFKLERQLQPLSE
jgi:hypothetical protein